MTTNGQGSFHGCRHADGVRIRIRVVGTVDRPDRESPVPNRLAGANSPYLLQHADNPVDWWEWGPAAFAAARARDVPVFLSVGYSACHWCHVMAHESFEDEATAAQLDDHFVSIKVDREERPDIDAIYMTATQALTGQGGWPMSVWLDHDQRPFYAGTYFPATSHHGRPSFRQVLTALSDAWRDRRVELVESAASITASLAAALESGARPGPSDTPDDDGPVVDAALVQRAATLVVERAWDRERGGFGRAPKFPQAMTIQFLLDHHRVTGDPDALAAAVSSLDTMARGGIHDHVVGGFARYSTDAHWLLPHFEKMLYDNGLLLEAYATAARLTGREDLTRVADRIATWLVDEMQAPDGGFFTALDADTDGEEGLTTVWQDDEFREVVATVRPAVDGDLAAAWFEVRAEGNFTPERGAPRGDNILHTPVPMAEFVAAHDLDMGDWQVAVDATLAALAARRATRPQPGLDDKVLADANALAIRGLAVAAVVLARPELADAALRALAFVRTRMVDDDGHLLHAHRAGRSSVPALLDDVAGIALAALELAPVVGRVELVDWARQVLDAALEDFADGSGGFHRTSRRAESLVVRPRESHDGATPAGTSLLARALVRLARLTGDDRHRATADAILAAVADDLERAPTGHGELLRAAVASIAPGREVAVVGRAGVDRDALALLALATAGPGTAVVVAAPDDGTTLEVLADRGEVDGRPAAYVCRDFVCDRPVTTPDDLQALLAG